MKSRFYGRVGHRDLVKVVFCVLVLFTPHGVARAQEQGKSLEFSVVTWTQLSFSQLLYRRGEEYVELKLSPGNRSRLYTLGQATGLELYVAREVPEGEKAGGEHWMRLVGKTSIPAGMSRMLFFVTETDEPGRLPLKVVGIDDSLLTFPRGACRFVNMTAATLEVTFADKKSAIRPKGMTVVKSKVKADGGLLPFVIRDSTGRNLYENRYFAQQIGRDMIFILPPTRSGGRVIVKLLPQLIARDPEEKEG